MFLIKLFVVGIVLRFQQVDAIFGALCTSKASDKCYPDGDCEAAGCTVLIFCSENNPSKPRCVFRDPDRCNVVPIHKCMETTDRLTCEQHLACGWCPRTNPPTCIDGCLYDFRAVDALPGTTVVTEASCMNVGGKYCADVPWPYPKCQYRHAECALESRENVRTTGVVDSVFQCENTLDGLWCPRRPNRPNDAGPCVKKQEALVGCFAPNPVLLPSFTDQVSCHQNRGVWCSNPDKCIQIPDPACDNCNCVNRSTCLAGSTVDAAQCVAAGCIWCTSGPAGTTSPQCILGFTSAATCTRGTRIPCGPGNVDYSSAECAMRKCDYCPFADPTQQGIRCLRMPFNPACYQSATPCTAATETECNNKGCVWCGDVAAGSPKCIVNPRAPCDSCDCKNRTNCHYDSYPTPNSCYRKGCAWCDKCDGVTKPMCAIINNQGANSTYYSPCTCSCGGGLQFKLVGNNCEQEPQKCSREYRSCNDEPCPNATCSVTMQPRYKRLDSCCTTNPSSTCGRLPPMVGRRKRVVGGTPVISSSHWPWLGIFVPKPGKICTAVLVNESFALTAAFCVKGLPMSGMTIRFGTYSASPMLTHVAVGVSAYIFPPDYYPLRSDISLIKLNSSMNIMSPDIDIICLPENENPRPCDTCYIAGWGRDNATNPLSCTRNLHELPVKILPHYMCENAYSKLGLKMSRDSMLCVGNRNEKGACYGDQGGAVMCQRCANCDWYVAGIISQGIGCGSRRQTVATKVSAFEHFFTDTFSSSETVVEMCAQ